jgi:hypothetical protein
MCFMCVYRVFSLGGGAMVFRHSCPRFNRGKFAPGGGRSTRSPSRPLDCKSRTRLCWNKFLLYVEPIKALVRTLPWFPFYLGPPAVRFTLSLFTLVTFPSSSSPSDRILPLPCSPVFRPPFSPSTHLARRVVVFACVYRTLSPGLAKGM